LKYQTENQQLSEEIRFHLLQLRDGTEDERYEAVGYLRESRCKHPVVIEALVDAIYNSLGSVRILAAETLSKFGERPADAIPVLTTVIDVADEFVFSDRPPNLKMTLRVAVGALGNFGKEAKGTTKHLLKALFDDDKNVSGYAALSLGKIGAVEALPALRAALEMEKTYECRCAIEEAIEMLKKQTQ